MIVPGAEVSRDGRRRQRRSAEEQENPGNEKKKKLRVLHYGAVSGCSRECSANVFGKRVCAYGLRINLVPSCRIP